MKDFKNPWERGGEMPMKFEHCSNLSPNACA